MHIGARSATVMASAPGAPIVVEARGGYFRGRNRLRACSQARTGDLGRRGAVPLLTLLSLFGAPFWVRSNEEAGPAARRLRPPNPVSQSKAVRMDGAVSTSRTASGYEIARVPRAQIVVDVCAYDCRRRDVQLACLLGRRGGRRHFGTMPLPTSRCRFGTPLWVGGSPDSYSSAGILRPSQSVSPPLQWRASLGP